METFSALLAICAVNSPVSGEIPAQRPVTLSVDVFFDLRLNKRLSKQSWGWWFETLSHPLWRHWNVQILFFECCADITLINSLRTFFAQMRWKYQSRLALSYQYLQIERNLFTLYGKILMKAFYRHLTTLLMLYSCIDICVVPTCW